MDWSDAWIHEGFATYMEALYAEHLGGLTKYHEYMKTKRQWFNLAPIAPRTSITCDSAFSTLDIYYKAAWVLHTIRYYLGDSEFFHLLRLWAYPDPSTELITHGDQCRLATTDDFLRIAEDITGKDLDWLFEVYLRQTSLPYIIADIQNDTLYLSWKTENQIPFDVPVEIKLGNSIIKLDMVQGRGKVAIPPGVSPDIDPNDWILMDAVQYENQACWVSQQSGTSQNLYAVHFHNRNIGWIAGSNGTILKTANGGTNWSLMESGTKEHLKSIYFSDLDRGWAAGTKGIILQTTNGGITWIKQISGSVKDLEGIAFYDSNIGLAVGDHGTILKTENGGQNWMIRDSQVYTHLYSIQFIDSNYAWIAGSAGTILKTSDTGENWNHMGKNLYAWFFNCNFIDENKGWAVGACGVIKKTTDGGNSWEMQNSNTSEHLASVDFINENEGWIVGSNGIVLNTIDAGVHWNLQYCGANLTLYDVCHFDRINAWAVGDYGNILKYGYITTSVTIDSGFYKIFPKELTLYQNYPNPFNQSTNIGFYLPVSQSITLTIYNLLGKKVDMVVNELLEKGKHIIQWYPENQSSGIYIYRLETGSCVKSGKCILLK
jgi:photosystem II stability/assembly factor-like uncharacterized protein